MVHELALRLGMTVGEVYERMSLEELTLWWPLYFDYERRMADEAEREADAARRRI